MLVMVMLRLTNLTRFSEQEFILVSYIRLLMCCALWLSLYIEDQKELHCTFFKELDIVLHTFEVYERNLNWVSTTVHHLDL